MKKVLSFLMASCMLAINAMPAFANSDIADVSSDYWARKEIVEVVNDGIMTLNSSNKFCPEAKMTRVEFVNSLLKVLCNQNLNVTISNQFTDVSTANPNYSNILRSQQLGLVYGYPDQTFKPNRIMTRSETQSVISHITVEENSSTSVLNEFKDYKLIPSWAVPVWAKSISYGIYVNYPDADVLRPNDQLTRAEAAVILARLKSKLSLVKEQYKGQDDSLVGREHLKVTKKAPCNTVDIYNFKNVVLEGNVLKVAFDKKFKSKEHCEGDVVYFTSDRDICTEEGTLLFPANSKFIATVLEVKDPKWFNKNARVYVQICKVIFPCGNEISMNAKPFYKNYELKEGPWMTAGKLAAYTAAGAAVGTGAGAGFAAIPSPQKIGTGIAIGAPVGAAVGLITGLVTKGLNYNAKCGEKIYVILLEDAVIPTK